MFSRKKYKPEFPRVCEYCEYAELLSNGSDVLCSKKGIVAADYHCRKFKYDLLKRSPAPPPPIPLPDISDMSL